MANDPAVRKNDRAVDRRRMSRKRSLEKMGREKEEEMIQLQHRL